MNIEISGVQFNVDEQTGLYDNWDFWGLVKNNKWEPDIFKVLNLILSKDKTFVDIGAWIGPVSLYGAQLAKHVYSIEPDPIAYNKLITNLSVNPNINITPFQLAIANTNGTIMIGSNSNMGDSMSGMLWNNNTIEVFCSTLNDFFKDNDIQDCNFIKMDIEGGEFEVLPHCIDFLRDNRITFHLSLHAPFFSNIIEYREKIMNKLSIFPYIYDSVTLKQIALQNINFKHFGAILCSFKPINNI